MSLYSIGITKLREAIKRCLCSAANTISELSQYMPTAGITAVIADLVENPGHISEVSCGLKEQSTSGHPAVPEMPCSIQDAYTELANKVMSLRDNSSSRTRATH